jgi:Methyltransferase domain
MEVCLICGGRTAPLFSLRVLAKYSVQYFHCAGCGFVRTENPYWLEEAYSDAIAVTDTGVLERNCTLAAKLACVLHSCLEPAGSYLDVAGGYGILTRLMRDYGFDYYWDDKYCANLLARGFEVGRASASFRAISAFEVLEHTVDPAAFISETMSRHGCKTLIFTTEIYSDDGPPPSNWWYLSPMTGQHISFFQLRTLRRLGERLGLLFYSSGGLHLYTDRKLRNAYLLPLFTSALAHPLARIIRRSLGSRTWSDSEVLAAKLEQSRPPSLSR